jgi:hypothetical protein
MGHPLQSQVQDGNASFALLDARADMANNVWDGGEGYASMSVVDPRAGYNGRTLWVGAVIEGDRDPAVGGTGPLSGQNIRDWTGYKGWFG